MSWFIVHNNCIQGQVGCSDGYKTEEEAIAVAKKLEEAGAYIYHIGHSET